MNQCTGQPSEQEPLLQRRMEAFLAAPTRRRYLALRKNLVASPTYDPQARRLLLLETRMSALSRNGSADREALTAWLDELISLPNCYRLASRFYFLHARLLESLGCLTERDQAIQAMRACLQGLLATGNGTPDAAYRPVFLTDERDLLRVLGESPRNHRLVQGSQNRCFDLITSHNGEEVWFDVTDLLARTHVVDRNRLQSVEQR